MYYKDGWLFRWRITTPDGTVTNHDNEPSSPDFLYWERTARDEGLRLRERYLTL
jgi:hypothetical protein